MNSRARPGVALIRRTYTNGYNTDHHVDVFLIVLYSASDHTREKVSSNVDEKPWKVLIVCILHILKNP